MYCLRLFTSTADRSFAALHRRESKGILSTCRYPRAMAASRLVLPGTWHEHVDLVHLHTKPQIVQTLGLSEGERSAVPFQRTISGRCRDFPLAKFKQEIPLNNEYPITLDTMFKQPFKMHISDDSPTMQLGW